MIRRFNRYELKYLLPSALRDALLPEIRERMQPDPEAGTSGMYRITSLYYDTTDLACYRAKLEGVKYRRKLRIRRYGVGGSNVPVMVEIKQRINRTVQKRRARMALKDALALCSGTPAFTRSDSLDREVVEEVQFLVRTLGLVPACLVGYERRPFVGGAYDPGLRITFDEVLWGAPPDGALDVPERRRSLMPPGWLVLEVKANDRVPLWCSNLLARHGCQLSRYSKYCVTVARLLATGAPVAASEEL
jgi:SPX domain protein involved in polyphosphate accumulation